MTTQSKILMQGAKGKTSEQMVIIANFPSVSARNLSPEDLRSNWVITGEFVVIQRLALALLGEQQDNQLYINLAMITNDCLNIADAA
jgi:hypothetical protein